MNIDFSRFFMILRNDSVFQGFPSSHGDGVYTIGKSIKIMIIDVEFVSFDELEPEISWIKGGPGNKTGGTPSDQSGGPLSLGGECFAPCFDYMNITT